TVSNGASNVDALDGVDPFVKVHICGAHTGIAKGRRWRGPFQSHVLTDAPREFAAVGKEEYRIVGGFVNQIGQTVSIHIRQMRSVRTQIEVPGAASTGIDCDRSGPLNGPSAASLLNRASIDRHSVCAARFGLEQVWQ